MSARPLIVRWTIGDVSAHGFTALRLSIHGVRCVLGDGARYVVCVNSVPPAEARRRAGAGRRGVAPRLARRSAGVAAGARGPALGRGRDVEARAALARPHQLHLGTCGAHFVGLNARSLGWVHEGKAGEDYVREHFERHRPAIEALVGVGEP